MCSNFRKCDQLMKDHSKIAKMHFWMIQKPKKEVFGHFLEFGLLDRLDIAYCERIKCFPTFGNVTRSWRIIQRSQISIFEWSKRPKMRFLAIFLSLVCWIGLILHSVIVLNVYQLSAMLPGQAGSFKNQKNVFLNDPKCQKGFFLDLGLLNRLDIAYDDRTKWVPTFRNLNSSWRIIQKCQNLLESVKICGKPIKNLLKAC